MTEKLRFFYRALRYRLRVDPAEIRFVRERLRAGQVAVDVGCHKGAYAFWMQRAVGPKGEVIAFEPQPRQVAYLQAAFTAMRYANVTLVPMGLSDAAGRLELRMPVGAGCTHGATFAQSRGQMRVADDGEPGLAAGFACEIVDVTTLDAYFAGHTRAPDFIKIDVEGHESAVLAGGRYTMETHHPTLLIECEARHRLDGDVRPVFELLRGLGYAGSFFHEGRRRALREFRPAEHQPAVARGRRPPRGYVNNFVFEHGARV